MSKINDLPLVTAPTTGAQFYVVDSSTDYKIDKTGLKNLLNIGESIDTLPSSPSDSRGIIGSFFDDTNSSGSYYLKVSVSPDKWLHFNASNTF